MNKRDGGKVRPVSYYKYRVNMRMNTIFDKEFLLRFIQGRCSEEERANFLQWLENVEDQDEISWMKEKWERPDDRRHKILGAEERILNSLLQRIETDSKGTRQRVQNKNLFLMKNDLWKHYSLFRYDHDWYQNQ